MQHARLPCPSLSPRVCSNSGQKMPSNHLILCHPLLILPSIFPSLRIFSDESALHSGWPKYRASASVLPVNIQGWFPLGWTGLISLQSKGLSRVFAINCGHVLSQSPLFCPHQEFSSFLHLYTCSEPSHSLASRRPQNPCSLRDSWRIVTVDLFFQHIFI